jgi:hypothetical protein
MIELDHLQADVLKDLSKMVIAGAGIMVFLGLLLWALMTSAEAAGPVIVRSHLSNDPVMNVPDPRQRVDRFLHVSRPHICFWFRGLVHHPERVGRELPRAPRTDPLVHARSTVIVCRHIH